MPLEDSSESENEPTPSGNASPSDDGWSRNNDPTHRRALEAALDYSSEAVAITEGGPLSPPGPRITYVNETFCQVTGFQKTDIVGQPLSILEGTGTNPSIQQKLHELTEWDSEIVRFRTLNYRKEGTTYIAEWMLSSLRDEDGDVQNWIAIQRDLTSQRDMVTGLESRDLFFFYVDEALLDADDTGSHVVLYLNLAELRGISNLEYMSRDTLLRKVATRLQNVLPKESIVTRIEGDNFGIFVPVAESGPGPADLARGVLDTTGSPFEIDDRQVRAITYVGVATVNPGDGPRAEVAVNSARIAAGHAQHRQDVKAQQDAQFAVFEPNMREERQARNQLEEELRSAIDRDEIQPEFQPIISLEDGRLRGFEALMRWHHPQRGILLPGDFIDVAIETGLLFHLDRRMLRSVVHEVETWEDRLDAPSPDLDVSVNVSAFSFLEAGFADEVADILDTVTLSPFRLAFEVTEQVLIQDETLARAEIEQLDALDIEIRIDDFGTEYASLALLRDLPVRALKVDQSFIDPLTSNEDARSIIRAVRDLATALDLTVIAEGIETEGQLHQLLELGCEPWHAQGFLFGRPVPPETAQHMMTGNTPLHAWWYDNADAP